MKYNTKIIITVNVNKSLKQIQDEIRDWNNHNFPNNKSYQALLGVSEEVGELCHAHLKHEQGIRQTTDSLEAKKDAVADITIFLINYCNQENIDFSEVLNSTWEQVKTRDWIKFPTNGKTE